jgi:hypothetical protein
MRNGFCGLRLRKAAIHCAIKIIWNLRNLTGGDQGAYRAHRDPKAPSILLLDVPLYGPSHLDQTTPNLLKE